MDTQYTKFTYEILNIEGRAENPDPSRPGSGSIILLIGFDLIDTGYGSALFESYSRIRIS